MKEQMTEEEMHEYILKDEYRRRKIRKIINRIRLVIILIAIIIFIVFMIKSCTYAEISTQMYGSGWG